MRYVARQPIFNRGQKVFGYELLFRSGEENFFRSDNVDRASSSVISDSIFVHGLDRLLAGRMAFINVSRNVLLEGLIHTLPSDFTVLEVLETIQPDDQVLAALRTAKAAGYTIALDDFVASPALEEMASLADIIKVDFLATDKAERKRLSQHFGSPTRKMLAEKIETQEDYKEALDCGYQYFQGYFFCKPEIVRSRSVPAFKLNRLQFLREVNQAPINFEKVERIVKQEASLSVDLLRFLNSAFFAWRSEINSIRHALSLLGEKQLRTWASLITMSGLLDDKPPELVVVGMTRARFCEQIGPMCKLSGREFDLFLLGLFSVLDALLDKPMVDVLPEFPVGDEVKQALLGNNSRYGDVYKLVMAYERGDWSQVASGAKMLALKEDVIADVHTQSVAWADQIFKHLS